PWAPVPAPPPHGGHTVHGGYPYYAPPGPPAAAPARPRLVSLVAGAAAVAVVAGGVGGAVGVHLERSGSFSQVELHQITAAEDRTAEPGTVAAIAEAALPGVVTLHVQGSGSGGTGTGFVLDDSGHILTNAHVVRPARDGGRIQVTFNDGAAVRAELVGSD